MFGPQLVLSYPAVSFWLIVVLVIILLVVAYYISTGRLKMQPAASNFLDAGDMTATKMMASIRGDGTTSFQTSIGEQMNRACAGKLSQALSDYHNKEHIGAKYAGYGNTTTDVPNKTDRSSFTENQLVGLARENFIPNMTESALQRIVT